MTLSKRSLKTISLFWILMCLPLSIQAQTNRSATQKAVGMEPFFNFQLWGMNQDYQGEAHHINQTMLLFRRGRFGVNAKVGDRWKMQLQLAMDGLGLVTTDTVKQSVNYRDDFSVWNIQAQYQVFDASEALYINAGYLLPYVGRESFTSPWSVSSLDKMRSSVALRYFVTGKTNGISPGLTAGGLVIQKKLFYGFTFMPGAFYVAEKPQTQSPLLMGQMLFTVVGNEFDTYRYVMPQNGYHQNFGLTIGLGGSYQGSTAVFQSNATLGVNALLVWKNFKIDCEYFRLMRTTDQTLADGYTFHVRSTYAFHLKDGKLETTAAFWENQGDDNLYRTPVYKENALDTGIDYVWKSYPIRLGVHYTYSLAKNKFTYAPSISNGAYINAVTLKLQANIH